MQCHGIGLSGFWTVELINEM